MRNIQYTIYSVQRALSTKCLAVVSSICLLLSFTQQTQAAITITNFSVTTTTSISFDYSGIIRVHVTIGALDTSNALYFGGVGWNGVNIPSSTNFWRRY